MKFHKSSKVGEGVAKDVDDNLTNHDFWNSYALYPLKRKPITQFPLSPVMQSSHFQND